MGVNIDLSDMRTGRTWKIVGSIGVAARHPKHDKLLTGQIVEIGDKWVLVTAMTAGGDVQNMVDQPKRVQGEFDSLADAIRATDEFFDEWLGA